MQGTIVEQGLELMLYGMGSVVIFLALLVVATTFMSRLVVRFFPEPVPPSRATPVQRPPRDGGPDPRITAAITAAVHQYRNDKR
jgi:oxaloacetate decarboxylase gamma subunit